MRPGTPIAIATMAATNIMPNQPRVSITRAATVLFALAAVASLAIAQSARADSPQALAAELSDSAFAMLNSINSDAKSAGPLLAPVASLASDAQALSTALQKNDRTTASHAMAAVVSDRNQIDTALKAKNAPNVPDWNRVETQIGALEAQVAPVAGPVDASLPPASPAPAAELPPAAPKEPQIVINSRTFSDGGVRVRGYFEGTDLKSAAIYDGDTAIKQIQVTDVTGEQRVDFDFGLQDPSPSQTIQVTDALGRVARAQLAPDAAALTHSPDAHDKTIELGGTTAADTVASEEPAPMPPPSANTAEIPREYDGTDDEGAPARRLPGGVGGNNLVNVQINVLAVRPVTSQPGSYEAVGQIAGAGVHRAGVYVNGRLMKPISLTGGSYSSFDVIFPIPPGTQASIRAYGLGNNFVEATIDTNEDALPTYSGPIVVPMSPYAYGNPYARPPYGYAPGYTYPPGYSYPPAYGYPPGYTPAPVPWYRRFIP